MSGFLRKLFKKQQVPQTTGEYSDLEKFFTNAEHARQVFEQLATSADLPKRILVIHGLGGVGKSTLLKMYTLTCRKYRIPSALVASEEAPSPVDVLAEWKADLNHYGITLPTFQKTLNHYRAIQAKVESEAQKGHHAASQIADTMGKTIAKTAVVKAASIIPGVGLPAGAVEVPRAEAIIDWLRGFLTKPEFDLLLDPTRRSVDDFLHDLVRADTRRRIILMIDTYEQMTALDDWVRELARRLPKNVLLVISGRAVPTWERSWPGWLGKAEILELKEMTPDDIRTLVHRYYALIHGGEPDPQQVEAIVQFARGLPMVATSVVQMWVKYGVEDYQKVRSTVVSDLVDRLLEGVPWEMRPAFEVAAVLRYFNVEALGVLLDGSNAAELYTELRRWPFIRSRRQGLAVHETMREMMNEALQVRTPERFRMLHERAAAFYEAQLEKATDDDREHYGLERLYHRVCADEANGLQLFQELAEEYIRSQQMNRLRTVLNDVNPYTLERENIHLWWMYYNGRLAESEGRLDMVERMYGAICENKGAELKLRVYALCRHIGYIYNEKDILFQVTDQIENLLHVFALSIGFKVIKKQSSTEFATFLLETGILFENIQIPERLPILVSLDSEISDGTVEHLRRLLFDGDIGYETQVAILILFCDHYNLDLAKRRIANRLGMYARDIVVINHDNLYEIVSAKEPQKEFRNCVLSQMNLVAVAPYTIAGPTPPHFFFGREHELREISDHLATTSYIVIGGRLVGKTSILSRLHCVRLPEYGFHTLYFDCSPFSTYHAFLSASIRDWKPEPPTNAPATFRELLQRPPDVKPFVLLLDEVDKFVPADRENRWQLFNTFRALMNSRQLQVVFSGERTLRDALKDSSSPFFNFANIVLLGPLDYGAVEELVSRPMKQLGIAIINQKSVVDYIYEFSSGHPNVVQRLCHHLIERLNEQSSRHITLAEVRAITEDPHFQEYDFLHTYWEGATPLEKIITLVLSYEVRAYRLHEVRQILFERAHLQLSARETKDALDRLVELRFILKRSQVGYEFAAKAFPLILGNTSTVEDLLEVLVEEYHNAERKYE